MATSAATLIQRTRRFLGDWPDYDTITASVTSGAATLTVADATKYAVNWPIQVDTEAMVVTSAAAGTSVGVRRGWRGTTAATHASGASVLIKPSWLDVDYLDALNAAIDASFPYIYQPVVDESVALSAGTFEYTVPNMTSPARPIPLLSALSVKKTSDTIFVPYRDWTVIRGATPKIHFRSYGDVAGTLRIEGYGPFPELALTDTLSTLWPANAEDYLVQYAAAWLLASGEAQRVRQDTGSRDDREAANRTGSSMGASSAMLQRAQIRLQAAAMPPPAKPVRPTF